MNIKPLHTALLLLAMFYAMPGALAQSFEERRLEILEKQKNTRAEINVLDARIKSFQKRIDETEADYNKSFKKFENLNTLIALQDDKIKSLESEKAQIEEEIALTQKEIDKREEDLKHLTQNMKKILLYSYKNSRATNLELLLTADSFNQMLVRSFYLNKIEELKTKQANQIKQQKAELDGARINLKQGLNKNIILLEEINSEKQVLNAQLGEQQKTVDAIRTERIALQNELKKNREQKDALENTFAALIAEEENIRSSTAAPRLAGLSDASAAESRARSRAAASASAVTDDMLKGFNAAFAAKKGELTWPVKSQTVSKKFGKTRHPVYGTETEHLGINIVTEPRSVVSVVADGYVFVISPISGFGDVVFVNHGGYYTAYGNLSQIDVVKNQVIKAGDRIGLSGGTNSPLGENVFFMVRREKTNLNPEEWLTK